MEEGNWEGGILSRAELNVIQGEQGCKSEAERPYTAALGEI